MASNFEFIRGFWPTLYSDARDAELNAHDSPRVAARCCRYVMEIGVNWIYHNDKSIQLPRFSKGLYDLINEPGFKRNLGNGLIQRMEMIRKLGNDAAHDSKTISAKESYAAVKSLWAFLLWIARTYTKNPPQTLLFKDSLIPKNREKKQEEQAEEIKRLQKKLEEKERIRQEEQEKSRETPDTSPREIAEIKAENSKFTRTFDYTESETRELFIDRLLREAGWDPAAPNTSEYTLKHMPDNNKGRADYVLWGNDGKPLAVIEAKRTSKSPVSGEQQAQLYADALEKETGQRPVIFMTNGYEHRVWDDTMYPPRRIAGFFTRERLELMIHRRTARQDLNKTPVDGAIVERYYHKEAIRRVNEAFQDHSRRKALIVMATGAGKTRLSIALVKQLMQSNWIKRALFLADRITLVKQAYNAYKRHYPEAPVANLLNERENRDSRVVFCTYPTMMNLIDRGDENGVKTFSPGHFDLVIIDEAHRSVYLKYRAIFEYFDSFLLGLTATPRDHVDRNTYNLFDLPDHMPTYYYELARAVKDNYLVPFRAVEIPVKFQTEGIRYDQLSEDEKEEYEVKFYDQDTGELPDHIESKELNNWLFNADTVRQVLARLMEMGQKIEGGDKLGKTIIFAANRSHAHFIREQFDNMYPWYRGNFMQVIETTISNVDKRIDNFYDGDRDPFIAVSVDMLDTGIDIAEIVNLVFFKKVRSRAKFWQMIGRGTRLCPGLFGPGQDKKNFYIFDFYGNFEYFNVNPEGFEPRVPDSLTQTIFKRRLLLTRLLTGESPPQFHGRDALTEKLKRLLHRDIDRLDLDSFTVRPRRKDVELFKNIDYWKSLSVKDIEILERRLSPLVYPDGNIESARRFDNLILQLQLALVDHSGNRNTLLKKLINLATPLRKLGNVPAVKEQMDLITQILSPEFRSNVSLPHLEDIRERLRDLIRFIGYNEQENVYIDFKDCLGHAAEVEGFLEPDPDFDDYREKVEVFLRENADHMTIIKLRTNRPITAQELEELERLLFSHCDIETREEFMEKLGTEFPLGQFIRRVLGMDKKAMNDAFSKFLDKAHFNASQINFMKHIIDYFHRNGYLQTKKLFSPPFTDLHTEGPLGIFEYSELGELAGIIRTINENAKAS